ncbi:MAG: hypothetical protein Q8S09_04450, partial [Hyphomonas sp.]|nr:hypothetical protein [Hyphomonas sp.]
VAAVEALDAPVDVTAEGVEEPGANGSIRSVLIVTAEPNEDTQLTEMIVELRRVALDLSDDRLPEEDQPAFETVSIVPPATGRAVIRGLPPGALLDVEVFYRGAAQALSPRVRVADVLLPQTDISSRVAIIEATAFASGIEPVGVVDVLPEPDGYDGPRIVVLTTDGLLYRLTPGGWSRGVLAEDIVGLLTDDQLEEIGAAKIAGQLTNDQIAGIAAAKIAGQITATQITDGAVTTGKIAAGAIVAGKISTGAIEADAIAANAVTAAKISAGAVEAGKIAAGAVVADKIAANAVTAGKINAGAVETDKLAASAVTAGKIAAGAVSATQIAAGAISTDKLAAGAIATDKIAAGAVTAAKIDVTSLSAITATIGLLRTASTGARMEIEDNQLRAYDSAGTLRVRLGIW